MTHGGAYLGGWKNIFNCEGAFSRFELWPFTIGSGVICLLPSLCQWLVVTINNDYGVFIFLALPVSFISTLIFVVPAIALATERIHDIGYSGWWATIVALIPVTGVILPILCCPPSKSQDQAQCQRV